jgi:hypothetical protein
VSEFVVSKSRAPADQFAEFFQWHAILPTPLHEALQEAAMKAGWTAPWDREEQKVQKKTAGKRSGAMRAGLAGMRRSLVNQAHMRLKPAYRLHPFSTHSIDALHIEYRQLLAPGAKNLGFLVPFILAALSENDRKVLSRVKRETLIKDLKVLGIRSKRQKQRSG